ncbi:hypothetical protein ALT721_440005 [Alteromonas alvinellae]
MIVTMMFRYPLSLHEQIRLYNRYILLAETGNIVRDKNKKHSSRSSDEINGSHTRNRGICID